MPDYNTNVPRSIQASHVLSYVCNSLEQMPPHPDNAALVHAGVIEQLRFMGAYVRREYPIPYMGQRGPRNGRIDVYAELEGQCIAIEIDARKPRIGSLSKLGGFDGLRIAATRGVSGECPEGIDALIAIPVRML